MSTQPEAMRVEDHPGVQGLAQLGRNAIDRVTELEQARARDNVAFKQLLAQRDALVEALRLMMDCAGDIATAPDSMLEMALDDDEEETRRQANAFLVARAAIAKAEGNT